MELLRTCLAIVAIGLGPANVARGFARLGSGAAPVSEVDLFRRDFPSWLVIRGRGTPDPDPVRPDFLSEDRPAEGAIDPGKTTHCSVLQLP